MSDQEIALDLPELLAPDWPDWNAAIGARLVKWLKHTPAVMAAWIESAALLDRAPRAELMVVALMESGHEESAGIELDGRAIVVCGIAGDVLRDTLEIDAELVAILANGYRLCGVESEVFELEALAREIEGQRA